MGDCEEEGLLEVGVVLPNVGGYGTGRHTMSAKEGWVWNGLKGWTGGGEVWWLVVAVVGLR